MTEDRESDARFKTIEGRLGFSFSLLFLNFSLTLDSMLYKTVKEKKVWIVGEGRAGGGGRGGGGGEEEEEEEEEDWE